MALRKRDKKGYPQFVGRILEWKSSRFSKGQIQYVRVAGFDYDIGVTFVAVDNKEKNHTCLNGPLSPNRSKKGENHGPIEIYDKEFQYALEVLRTNSVYDVDEKYRRLGEEYSGVGTMVGCAFGV